MNIPNMVPTPRTRSLAARLIEMCQHSGTTGVDAVAQHLFSCARGQEAALVAAILDHKTGTPVALRPDWNDDGSQPNLAVACWAGIDAAATAYGATPEQILRGGRPNIDVPARRVAMTVAHLAGGGYSEIGRFFNKDHSTVVTGVKWCLATPAAYAIAEQALETLRAEIADRDSGNDPNGLEKDAESGA